MSGEIDRINRDLRRAEGLGLGLKRAFSAAAEALLELGFVWSQAEAGIAKTFMHREIAEKGDFVENDPDCRNSE